MEVLIYVGVLAVCFFVWVISNVRIEKQRKKKFRQMLENLKGQMPSDKYVEDRLTILAKRCKEQEEEFMLDDITWNDLSMDEVFKRMNYSYSAAGEEMLYRILRTPCFSKEELAHRRELIRYFQNHDRERVEMQIMFASIGRTGKYSVYDYLEYLRDLPLRKNLKEYIALSLMAVFAGMIFAGQNIGIAGLFTVVIYNVFSYLKIKGEITPYISTFAYILRLLKQVEKFVNVASDVKNEEAGNEKCILEKELRLMQKNAKLMEGFQKGAAFVTRAQNATGSDPMEIVGDYIAMIFHIDLIRFNKMHKLIQVYSTELIEMFETVGYMEAMISAALFRESMPYYCEPELAEERDINFLQAEALYHPLVENAVANSISCRRGILLTGSNASGKSTFLKTVAINVILSQTIDVCAASAYQTGFFRVYTSMSLKDNLFEKESYFIVEIKAIKRILDACKETDKPPVICFVDEVLRGTNTAERIAASTEILKSMQTEQTICFAATHDLELTRLLGEKFENYHFEEKLVGNDVTFAYKLLQGEATTRNAIELLRVLGFDEKLIKRAHENAAQYI